MSQFILQGEFKLRITFHLLTKALQNIYMSHHELITQLASYMITLAIHQQNELLCHNIQQLEEMLTAKVSSSPKSIQQPIYLAMANYAKKITFDYHCMCFLEQAVELDVHGLS